MTIVAVSAFQVTASDETAGQHSIRNIKRMTQEAVCHRHPRQPSSIGLLDTELLNFSQFQFLSSLESEFYFALVDAKVTLTSQAG